MHAKQRDTPRVVAPRQDYVETVVQHHDTRLFHFLNKTGLHLDAYRRYARAAGGQRVGPAVPLKRAFIGLLAIVNQDVALSKIITCGD